MIEKREVYMVSNPFIWDYELFYLTYNKKTNKIEFNGKELNNDSYNLDDIIIMWDGKDHDYHSAHPKQFVNVYRSNSNKPEDGYIFVGKEDYGDLRYYYKREEFYNMLITKQYVVFGKDRDEIYSQLNIIKDEFSCAGWEVKESASKKFLTELAVTKNNVRICIYPYIIGYSNVIRWDNCWISDSVSDKAIQDIIMPLSISDTPEVHFF